MTGHLTQWLCLQPLHDIVLWSKKAQRIPEQKGGQCGWNTGGMGRGHTRCVRWRQGPSHVRADGPIRKLDFILNTLGSPLGNLKQGSDIRFDVGAWGLREHYHWWIIQMMNQNARTRGRGG